MRELPVGGVRGDEHGGARSLPQAGLRLQRDSAQLSSAEGRIRRGAGLYCGGEDYLINYEE